MRKLLFVIGILLVLGLAALLAVGFFLGSLVESGVNRLGPKVTQTDVALEDAQLSPFTGRGTLQNLSVANPAGWSAGNAISLGEVQLHVQPTTVWKDPMVIEELVVNRPQFVYEQKLTGGSNLKDLLENVQQAIGTPDRPIGAPEEPARKFIIKRLRLNEGSVRVGLGPAAAEVPLPELAYDNLGVAEGGLTGAQIAQVVLSDLVGRVIGQVTSRGILSLPKGAGDALQKMGGALEKSGLPGLFGREPKTPPPAEKKSE